MLMLPFRDRHQAGRVLGGRLAGSTFSRPVVLGIPRGGVQVGYEIAHRLHAPLDIFLLRHLAAPGEPDEVFGCIGSGGSRLLRPDRLRRLGLSRATVDEVTRNERISLLARERTYRGQTTSLDVRDQGVVLVDDGSSTQQQLREALLLLREQEPARLVLAVPVIAEHDAGALLDAADDIVALLTVTAPLPLTEVYAELLPVSHTEVRALLALAAAEAQSRELAALGEV